MVEPLTRRCLTALVALAVLAASSAPPALGARSASRHARHGSKAAHRGARRGHRRRHHGHRKPGATTHSATSQSAYSPPGTLLLGEPVVRSTYDWLPPGEAEAFRLHARSSGSPATAYLYLSWGNAARSVYVGLYSDAGDRPGALLSRGSALAGKPDSWMSVAMSNASVTGGTIYWLAILGTGGTLRYRDEAGGPCPAQTNATTTPSLPGAWRTAAQYDDCPVSGFLMSAPAARERPLHNVAVEPPPGEAPPVEAPPPPPPTPPGEVSEPPPAPANTSAPVIAGSPVEGQMLSATPGSWSGSPTSFAYRWQDCNALGEGCLDIPAASGPSYTLALGDVGQTVRAVVTAMNAGGSAEAASSASALVEAPPPPPPSPPVNTVAPALSGSAVEGQTLRATAGSWSGSPTSFAYQWQDCNALGAACAAISGATSASYVLLGADVGHTVRVVVTAINAGGSAEAASSASALVEAPPPPPPPPPVNTAAPAVTGSAVEGQTLSATAGSWSGSPSSFAYQWQDCNSLGAACANVAGATASTYKLLAADVGHTLRAVVTATNAGGSTPASSATTALVLPLAPGNTAPPAVSGSAVEGQTLSATAGSWSGSPNSFAYQWQDCNALGAACIAISGATSASYKLGSGDVGHTLRTVVTATNAGGSTPASSSATAVVTTPATGRECFENPATEGSARFEACGYPGPRNTGVDENGSATECSELPEYTGSITSIPENTTITGKEIRVKLTSAWASGIRVTNRNVTLRGDCVLVNGGEHVGPVITIEGAGSGFTLADSTIRGENSTTSSFEEAVRSESLSMGVQKVERDRIEDCGECLHGNFEATGSYLISNQNIGKAGGLHREPWYLNNGVAIARGDTILVPEDQTAVIFANVANGVEHVEECSDRLTLENNLIAGSGQMIQTCGPRSLGNGTATLTVRGNRFARCLTVPVVEKRCSGHGFEGADSHGYFPAGGWISLLGEPPYGSLVWEGNFWDDNLETVAK
jgi:hypothetical protein